MLFIDTCYMLALLNKKAKDHDNAKKIKELIKDEYTMINSTVKIEMLNNIHKKRYEKVRNEILQVLDNMDEIDYLTPEDYDKALKICKKHNYNVNYSDCTIKVSMMKHNINTIVSFDGDFDNMTGINRYYL